MSQVYIATSNDDSSSIQRLITSAATNVGLDTSLCCPVSDADADACTAQEKFKLEITKLLQVKCAILELTNPNAHDIGFYAGYLFADRPKLPVLGLTAKYDNRFKYEKQESQSKLAHMMLSGCPQIQHREYNPERPYELKQIISDWLIATKVHIPRPAGPVILIVGAPGSGKTTQAYLLSEKLGIPVIPVLNPKYVIAERLSRPDCQQGYILDNHFTSPPTEEYYNNLRELGVQPNLIVYLFADRETCISRQITKNGVMTGCTYEMATRCLNKFISGFPSLQGQDSDAWMLRSPTEFNMWFPNTSITNVFTAAPDFPPEKVLESILIQSNLQFTVNCTEPEWQSTNSKARIHFSINGANQQLVAGYAKKSNMACKVYPITYTARGCEQVCEPEYARLYAKIYYPTCEIVSGDMKAIATGFITYDGVLPYLKFLEQLSTIPIDERGNAPISADLTETIWYQKVFFTVDGKKDSCETHDYSVSGWTNWSRLPYEIRDRFRSFNSFKLVENNIYKITHTLDIPKLKSSRNELDEWICKLTSVRNVGCILVFETPTDWSIHINYMFLGSYEDCKTETLQQQANIYRPFLVPVINTSIELVHGIWCHQ
jgi:adenylate kinase family enzyme